MLKKIVNPVLVINKILVIELGIKFKNPRIKIRYSMLLIYKMYTGGYNSTKKSDTNERGLLLILVDFVQKKAVVDAIY